MGMCKTDNQREGKYLKEELQGHIQGPLEYVAKY